MWKNPKVGRDGRELTHYDILRHTVEVLFTHSTSERNKAFLFSLPQIVVISRKRKHSCDYALYLPFALLFAKSSQAVPKRPRTAPKPAQGHAAAAAVSMPLSALCIRVVTRTHECGVGVVHYVKENELKRWPA